MWSTPTVHERGFNNGFHLFSTLKCAGIIKPPKKAADVWQRVSSSLGTTKLTSAAFCTRRKVWICEEGTNSDAYRHHPPRSRRLWRRTFPPQLSPKRRSLPLIVANHRQALRIQPQRNAGLSADCEADMCRIITLCAHLIENVGHTRTSPQVILSKSAGSLCFVVSFVTFVAICVMVVV